MLILVCRRVGGLTYVAIISSFALDEDVQVVAISCVGENSVLSTCASQGICICPRGTGEPILSSASYNLCLARGRCSRSPNVMANLLDDLLKT